MRLRYRDGVIRNGAVSRVILAVAAGAGVGAALATRLSAPVAGLGGWNAGGVLMLALSWIAMARCDASETAKRAAREDPGRKTVYVIILLTSAASLLAATPLARSAKGLAPQRETGLVIALCLATVALSWALTHTAFTLRYAHLYYREDDEGVGGVEFPGGARPGYLDFAYLSFTVGMCFQVSDVAVSSPQIRRAVLLQALMSFVYNTAIVAFVLNLVFGLAG